MTLQTDCDLQHTVRQSDDVPFFVASNHCYHHGRDLFTLSTRIRRSLAEPEDTPLLDMVYHFTSNVTGEPAFIYVGKDKVESTQSHGQPFFSPTLATRI